MKVTDGLFLKVGERVSKEYPDIKFNNMIIDNWLDIAKSILVIFIVSEQSILY